MEREGVYILELAHRLMPMSLNNSQIGIESLLRQWTAATRVACS